MSPREKSAPSPSTKRATEPPPSRPTKRSQAAQEPESGVFEAAQPTVDEPSEGPAALKLVTLSLRDLSLAFGAYDHDPNRFAEEVFEAMSRELEVCRVALQDPESGDQVGHLIWGITYRAELAAKIVRQLRIEAHRAAVKP